VKKNVCDRGLIIIILMREINLGLRGLLLIGMGK